MKKFLLYLLVIGFGLLCINGTASALSFGTEVTVFDGNATGSGWYGPQEDNEVEPGNEIGQKWDLEGIFFDYKTWMLTIVGGYDFVNGATDNSNRTWRTGDIFIDIDGDAHYNDSSSDTYKWNRKFDTTFGYDFVFTLDFSQGVGVSNVYDLRDGGSTFVSYFGQNHGSDPWRYAGGGSLLTEGLDVALWGYGDEGPLTDEQTGFNGGNHYAISLDMSVLKPFIERNDTWFIAKYTMQCGNDNIIGRVPEPSVIILFGIGLLGTIAIVRRKKT